MLAGPKAKLKRCSQKRLSLLLTKDSLPLDIQEPLTRPVGRPAQKRVVRYRDSVCQKC